MPMHADMVTARDAAQALGVSLDTLRRWDREGRIEVVRDERNRRMVPEAELRRLLGERSSKPPVTAGSARNRMRSVVRSVQVDGLLAQVELETVEPARLVAIVTREAIEELGIREGQTVDAVVKATSMMLDTERPR